MFSVEDALKEAGELTEIEYEQRRESLADLIGVRVSALDKLVRKIRANRAPETTLFTELEPWPDTVRGNDLLGALCAHLNDYLSLPRGADVAIALWVLHSWVLDAAGISPILMFTSPDRRCGKTTALLVLQGLVHRPLPTSNITAAALFRVTEKYQPTLLVDEADTFLKGKHASDELRGILNSGHNRGAAFVVRTVGENFEPKKFATWAPKAIALIGKPHPTIVDRSIAIEMTRKRASDRLLLLRADQIATLFLTTARQCAAWALENLEIVRETDPDLIPDYLNDRAADNWRPLLAIADVCGWQEQALIAIRYLSADETESETYSTMLLADIQMLFERQGIDRLSSADIVEALADVEERPWPEWRHGKPMTQRQLAKLLAPFKIKPKLIKFGKSPARGYELSAFTDTFERYLPGVSSVTPLPLNDGNGFSDIRSVTRETTVTDEKTLKASEGEGCNAVTDGMPPTRAG